MNETKRSFSASALIAVLMFLSRILGFFRDMSTAAMMGMSGSAIADAFFLAFRFPNLGRRLIEEGALGLSWIPAFSGLWRTDRPAAWRLLAAFLSRASRYGLIAVAVGEVAALLCAHRLAARQSPALAAVELLMLMLPYFYFALLTAGCAATLQATGRFGIAASVAMIFNLVWLAVLFVISPFGVWLPIQIRAPFDVFCGVTLASLTPFDRAAILAVTIVAAAFAQFFVQRVYLTRLERRDRAGLQPGESGGTAGAAETRKDPSAERTVTSVFRAILPTALGLLFVQINTLLAAVFASTAIGRWGFLSGTAAAIYYAERLYEFPLGLIGVAVGTAFYPLLVRRAAERDFAALSSELAAGIRAVLLFSIPAAAGLYVVAGPLATLLYQRGDFSAEDARRTAGLVQMFALAVPVYCVQPILIRTFYALGDKVRPILAGLLSTAVFCVGAAFFLTILPLGERGLVAGIGLGALAQLVYLITRLTRTELARSGKIELNGVFTTLGRSAFAAAAMVWGIFGAWGLLSGIPGLFENRSPMTLDAVRVGSAVFIAIFVYFGFLRLLGEREIFRIFRKNG